MGALEIFVGDFGDTFWCPGDISWVSWRYLMGVMEILDKCCGDI